jgi:UDP:flavonoid glycosyltransferase YjiC (YdhE family)
MNILLATYGSAGDVRPLLALGQALRKHGHHIRVCAPPDSRPLFASANLPYTPLGGNVRQLMATFADRLVDRPLASAPPMTRLLKRELELQFQQLPAEVAAADLVLFSGLALTVPSLAEACGVPYRYAVSIPALLPSRHHAPLTVPWQNLPPLCNLLLWYLAGGLLDLCYRSQVNRHRRQLGLRPLKRVMTHLTANMMVAADRELAPLPPEAPLDCCQTGYWHAPLQHSLPASVERFLDKEPPPIYIGFGSMGDPQPRRTLATFKKAVHQAGLRAVIQSGWAGWRFESDATCLCVIDDLPHDRLFPRVAGAVHHGGAGTTFAAARAGIPQVIVPHLLDQYYWGQRILKMGLGPHPLPKNRLQAGSLAGAMRSMVSSPTLRRNARMMSKPLQQRNGVQEAVRWLTA